MKKETKAVATSPETYTELMAKIKKTAKLGDDIRKSIGQAAPIAEEADDMYEYDYKKPDSEVSSWTIFHGKCFEKGSKQLKDWGYAFVQVQHFPKSNKLFAGVRCSHCEERLDENIYAQKIIDRTQRLKDEHEAYQEWEQEQILLGKR